MESLAKIYETYYERMLNYAKKYVNESYAEDIVHDVFVKLVNSEEWTKKLILAPSEEQRHILFAFLHNACCNIHRQIKTKNKIFSDISGSVYTVCENSEQEYQKADFMRLLMDILKSVNRQNRDIFMKHFEGYSIKEIAEQTGLSERAIESRLYRTLYFLKTRILYF
jgi:RNA polymerase sigma-70 factor (ECF subfamily)